MIRLATWEDLPEMLRVYEAARAYMARSGNPLQWADGHPTRDTLENDLTVGNRLYVMEENGRIHAAFAFMLGDDPTYAYIENGQWLNDRPYGTVHRIGSDGETHGVLEKALDFCRTICPNIRIDTYKDNHTMLHLILKNGFTPCGTIYLENGSPRLAFQKDYGLI